MSEKKKTINDYCNYLEEQSKNLNALKEIDPYQFYRQMISLGEKLKPFPSEYKSPNNRVNNCTTNTYIHATFSDGVITYQGTSDSEIVKGQVALLINGLSGLKPVEIITKSERCLEDFLKSTGIKEVLTPSRTKFFGNGYLLMKQQATAYLDKDI
ncbi:MAG: SufE family protein [archaeon]